MTREIAFFAALFPLKTGNRFQCCVCRDHGSKRFAGRRKPPGGARELRGETASGLASEKRAFAKKRSWLWQLILAADQFIVKRSLPEKPDGCRHHRRLSLGWRLGAATP